MRFVFPFLFTLLGVQGALSAEAPGKKMESDKPMTTKMKKPGMKQSDVKHEADKKARKMKPELEREEKSMRKDR